MYLVKGKAMNDLTNLEKTQLGQEAFASFFEQFGNDTFSIVMLEILFEMLMDNQVLRIK